MTEAELAAFRAAAKVLDLGPEQVGRAVTLLQDCGGEEGARLARWIKQGRLDEARTKIARALRDATA